MDLKALTVEQLKSDLEALWRVERRWSDWLVDDRHACVDDSCLRFHQERAAECAALIAAIEAELAERELARSPQGPPCWTCGKPTIMYHLPPDSDSPAVHYLRCSGKDEACITGGYHPSAQAAIANYPRRDTAEAERAEPEPAPAPALPPCYTCGEPLTIVHLGPTDKRPMEFYLECTGPSCGCILGGDWPSMEEAIAHYPKRESVHPDLLVAAKLGLANLQMWLDAGECDCEGAYHTCGRVYRLHDAGTIRAAIAKAEGKP